MRDKTQIKHMQTCPECGNSGLLYSINADITFIFDDNGVLKPNLDEGNIQWLEDSYLYCPHCQLNDIDSNKLYELKHSCYN